MSGTVSGRCRGLSKQRHAAKGSKTGNDKTGNDNPPYEATPGNVLHGHGTAFLKYSATRHVRHVLCVMHCAYLGLIAIVGFGGSKPCLIVVVRHIKQKVRVV